MDNTTPRLKNPIAVSNICNVAAVLLGVVIVCFSESLIVIILSLLFPMFVFVLFIRYAGQLTIIAGKGTQLYPNTLVFAFVIPILLSVVMYVIPLNILSYWIATVPMVVLSGVLSFFFWRNALPYILHSKQMMSLGLYLLCAVFYSIAAVLIANTQFDFSTPKNYKAKVQNTFSVNHRSRAFHYATLSPWGPQTDSIDISMDAYQFSKGDTVIVSLKRGLLFVPWYNVRSE